MHRIELPLRRTDEPSAQTASFKANAGYWWEGVAYAVTPEQEGVFRAAAKDLLERFDEALDHVVRNPSVLKKFYFVDDQESNAAIQSIAAASWKNAKERSYILDRWDMAWDGVNPPKLLERNFGNMGLIESTGIVQEDYVAWLQTQAGHGDARTFGSLRENFIEAFREVARDRGVGAFSPVSLIVAPDRDESDKGMIETSNVLISWIRSAGFEPVRYDGQVRKGPALGLIITYQSLYDTARTLTGEARRSLHEKLEDKALDSYDKIIDAVKGVFHPKPQPVYPFYNFHEYAYSLADAKAGQQLLREDHNVLEPAWTLLMEHKSMLPILSALFPKHPNLLKTTAGNKGIKGQKAFVKHVHGCQGRGAKVVSAEGKTLSKRADFKVNSKKYHRGSNFVSQAYCPAVSNPDGSNKVVHLFTTNRRPAAIGTRESPLAFVGGSNTRTQFVPVIIRDEVPKTQKFSYEALDGSSDLSHGYSVERQWPPDRRWPKIPQPTAVPNQI